MTAPQTPLNDARLTDRLQAQLDAVEQTINSGGRDEFDPRDLPFVLRDAIEALAARSVPEGWVAVPREPTPEMLTACYHALGEVIKTIPADILAESKGRRQGHRLQEPAKTIVRWKAMLAAVPAPEPLGCTNREGCMCPACDASTEHAGAAEGVEDAASSIRGSLATGTGVDPVAVERVLGDPRVGVSAALATHPVTVAEGEPSVDDIAEVLFHQRQTGYRWSDALLSEPESDPGTLVSICRDDAEAVLALYRASPIQSEVGKP